jgi:hypothetical protein
MGLSIKLNQEKLGHGKIDRELVDSSKILPVLLKQRVLNNPLLIDAVPCFK